MMDFRYRGSPATLYAAASAPMPSPVGKGIDRCQERRTYLPEPLVVEDQPLDLCQGSERAFNHPAVPAQPVSLSSRASSSSDVDVWVDVVFEERSMALLATFTTRQVM